VSFLEGDREADYYLFDEADRPIRFVIDDMQIKMMFRMLRSDVMFAPAATGVEALAEYAIKRRAHKPGFSRARILAQFQKEYGVDIAAMVEELGAKTVQSGYEPGTTWMEAMSRGYGRLGEL
jgi:hypothetical protein